jgi:hypothetical protein
VFQDGEILQGVGDILTSITSSGGWKWKDRITTLNYYIVFRRAFWSWGSRREDDRSGQVNNPGPSGEVILILNRYWSRSRGRSSYDIDTTTMIMYRKRQRKSI